jgi:hypothetical protein
MHGNGVAFLSHCGTNDGGRREHKRKRKTDERTSAYAPKI